MQWECPHPLRPFCLVLLCCLSFSLPHTEDSPVMICCFLGLRDSTQKEWVWVTGQERREEREKRIQLSRKSKTFFKVTFLQKIKKNSKYYSCVLLSNSRNVFYWCHGNIQNLFFKIILFI